MGLLHVEAWWVQAEGDEVLQGMLMRRASDVT